MLEPLLVGWPVLRQVVTNALAARGHLVLCELGDVRFFVDPGDRVVGAWLMWHGGWQRREIDAAVEALLAAGRLQPGAAFIDIGAHIGTHTVYALRTTTTRSDTPLASRFMASSRALRGSGSNAIARANRPVRSAYIVCVPM